MSDELTRAESENPVCDCSSSAWVCRTGGWYCCHCGKWQCSISGRVSIRDPEPFHDLKPVARAFVRKHGSKNWTDLGPVEDPLIAYDFTEAERAIYEAYYNWDPYTDGCGDT